MTTKRRSPQRVSVELNCILSKNYGAKYSLDDKKCCLCQHNLFGCHPAKKPLILLKNRPNQICIRSFALDFKSQKSSKVLFSDESKFCMFSSDGIKYVRCPKGERLALKYPIPTVKHGGGNTMVWGCFCCDSIGPIHCIKSIIDQNVYLDNIKNVMLPHGKDKMPCRLIF